MTGSSPAAKLPLAFIVVTFVVAAAVCALIIYFGLHGELGASIP